MRRNIVDVEGTFYVKEQQCRLRDMNIGWDNELPKWISSPFDILYYLMWCQDLPASLKILKIYHAWATSKYTI